MFENDLIGFQLELRIGADLREIHKRRTKIGPLRRQPKGSKVKKKVRKSKLKNRSSEGNSEVETDRGNE